MNYIFGFPRNAAPALLLCLALGASIARAQPANTSSPNNRVQIALDAAGNKLAYRVNVKGQTAIEPSALGVTVDGKNLGENATLGQPVTRTFRETYPVMGVHAMATNAYREAVFPVQSGATKWQLEVRAFDDGVAVRYRVPLAGQHTVNGESSAWKVPAGSVVWYQTGTQNYESAYQERLVENVPADANLGAPLVAKLPGGLGYAFMTEANLVNYSDMSLRPQGERTFGAYFRFNQDGWKTEGEIVSPWRVTMLTPDLDGLVNSDILRNLCPPPAPALANAAWIVPGRGNWHWLVTGHPQFSQQHQWVNWTQQLGFEYYLIDDGWRDWREGDKGAWDLMKETVDYARAHNVKIWAWVHSREVFKSEDRLAYFQKAKAAGVVGLKIDFPEAPGVEWVNWYDAVLRDAAAAQLMMDFHGTVKPTGRDRTYPHELTREAVLGRESGKLPALHDVSLPFTRDVQGNTDYTPTDFRLGRLNGSSWARELAQAIVYTSPFLCYGGAPASYLDNPALDILKAIPPTWDETRVIGDSEIGRTAAFARRKGNVWFVGVINANDARPFRVNLDFLGAGSYRAELLADSSETNAAFTRSSRVVTSRDSLPFDLRPPQTQNSPQPNHSLTHEYFSFTSRASTRRRSPVGLVRGPSSNSGEPNPERDSARFAVFRRRHFAARPRHPDLGPGRAWRNRDGQARRSDADRARRRVGRVDGARRAAQSLD